MKTTTLAAASFLFSSASAWAIDLPDSDTQNEIKQQLAELSSTGISPVFAAQFDKLMQSSGTDNYADAMFESYSKIKCFSEQYAALSWDKRQSFAFQYKDCPVSEEIINQYAEGISSGTLRQDVENLRPQVPQYAEYRAAINELLGSAAVPLTKYPFMVLRKNSRGSSVAILRNALTKKGYLSEDLENNAVFDKDLDEAVKKFQEDNGLKADGIVGFITYEALYKNELSKAVALSRSMWRLSDPVLQEQKNFVFVNVPETMAYAYEDGNRVFESKVVVGRKTNKTPLLASQIHTIVLNPLWSVPPSIRDKEYLPKLRADPDYLAKHGFKMVDSSNNVVSQAVLTEEDLSKKHLNYRLVQVSGSRNALGLYKFDFQNPFSVYLHSTSSPRAFGQADRRLSHGCVRVEKSKELAEQLLKTQYEPEKIAKMQGTGKTVYLKVDEKPHVFIAYITAVYSEEQTFIYYPDLYGYDENAVISEDLLKYMRQDKDNN